MCADVIGAMGGIVVDHEGRNRSPMYLKLEILGDDDGLDTLVFLDFRLTALSGRINREGVDASAIGCRHTLKSSVTVQQGIVIGVGNDGILRADILSSFLHDATELVRIQGRNHGAGLFLFEKHSVPIRALK